VKLGRHSSRTDPGRKRRHNEDSFVVQPPLFAIADGMGGAQAGEIASALAAGALSESNANGGGETRVTELIQEANRRVHERASTDPSTSGMGTTMTVALIEGDGTITFGHVGDSRAYRLRGGRLEQITDDHSLVAELVRRGELSAQEAEVHPQRSVITRALGTDPDVDVDAFSVRPQAGDLYLLCSDGLSDMVPAEAIEEILREYRGDLDTATRALIRAANNGGGDDNITAVLFEIVDGDSVPAGEPDERTRELPTMPHDEEETLHPEDRVSPPEPAPAPPEDAATPPGAAPAEAAAAVDPAAETQRAEPTEAPPSPVDTMVVPPAEIQSPTVAEPETDAATAGIGRRLLALLVIAVLVAVIVVLVWWGLAR
jgi:PPM family protein phosphatase